MRIGGIADAVELKISVAQACVSSLGREFGTLGKLYAIGCRLHAVIAELTGVTNSVKEIRRECGLASRKLHRHLAPRLDGNCIVEQRLDFFPGKLVHEPNLVRVHKTRVTHHIAAVGEVDGQDRATTVLDGAAAVIMQFLVVVGTDVAAGERVLQMPEELRINGEDIFEMSVEWAILYHQNFAVALDDLRLDFTGFLV